MTMTTLTYQVSFNTPAFLGNAEQQAQWRTPPFKALLRQWWRVVKAPEVGYDHHKLLHCENKLFGSAGASDEDSTGGGRSNVQLRLSAWGNGSATVQNGSPVVHPDVRVTPGANLYLGYGPLGGSVARRAIAANVDSLELKLRFPTEFESELRKALQLAHWFGTVGSRSRNGWGAIHLAGEGILPIKELNTNSIASNGVLLETGACLGRDWPHAIGTNTENTPSIWCLGKLENKQLEGLAGWEDVMFKLAQIKIAVRTSEFFKFDGGGKDGHATPQARHLLSYPSGKNHEIQSWGRDARLTNQIRFKVHRRADGKFMAVIVHVPCALPSKMADKVKGRMPDQLTVWTEVHRLLDAQRSNGLIRLTGAT
jgi:CRISPR-associated protein Cmr1